MSGTCDTGYVFLSCANGFRGCCSQPACDLGGCPDDAKQSDDPTSSSTTGHTNVVTLTTTRRTSTTTAPTSFSTDPITTSTTGIVDPTAGSSPGTTLETATPSLLPSPTTPTDPTSTSAAQSSSNGAGSSSSLSTAAIVGICVGGTVLAMFALLVVALRIRRHRIAKRHAAAASAGFHYAEPAFAENFMKDHPSVVNGRVELG